MSTVHVTSHGKNDMRQNVRSEEMSIVELFSRSKHLQVTAAKVVKEIEVMSIDVNLSVKATQNLMIQVA